MGTLFQAPIARLQKTARLIQLPFTTNLSLAEQIVSDFVDALMARAGWLFGGIPEARKNFVAGRIESCSS